MSMFYNFERLKKFAHQTLQIPGKQWGTQTPRKKKQIKLLPQGGISKRGFLLFPCVILNILF